MLRKISIVLCFLLPLFAQAQDARNDSVDVLHYGVHLDITDFAHETISGKCDIEMKSLIGLRLQHITLDLLKLTVDSVRMNGTPISYLRNDSILIANLLPLQQDDFILSVYYHGHPQTDPSGFGGFAFSKANEGVAYNLGVGITMIPHNLGRSWFPSIDDFTDKALFDFDIITPKQMKAFCNGILTDSSYNSNGTRIWKWTMAHPIPCYLAAVAVSHYATLYSSYKSISGKTIPIQIGVYPTDSSQGFAPFEHLKKCLTLYENLFGYYPFSRVGYVAVPENAGAMEHPGNIAYPELAISGGHNYEFLWDHELSHAWFGDLVTCSSAADMWLNEGWATYCQALVDENFYGKARYINSMLANHIITLSQAPFRDSGYWPLSPIPQKFTYGITTYYKGADVLRAIRNELGDSVFFSAIKSYLAAHAYGNVNSNDFEKSLEKIYGKSLASFFQAWVYQPGLPHFEITKDSVQKTGFGYQITAHILQRLWHAPQLYPDNKLIISAFDSRWNRTDSSFLINDSGQAVLNVRNFPQLITINTDGNLPDATTRNFVIIKSKALTDLSSGAYIKITTDAITDSALLYVEYHWVGPLQTVKHIRLSANRYWTIGGIWPENFKAHATIIYHGRTNTNHALDNDLFTTANEDSIVLLYRSAPDAAWQLYPDYKIAKGSPNDKYGIITANSLQKGDYALGVYDYQAGIRPSQQEEIINIFPNPAENEIQIESQHPLQLLKLTDITGKEIEIRKPHSMRYILSTSKIANGIYILTLYTATGVEREKIIINH